mgnify:CR=1 FL=1
MKVETLEMITVNFDESEQIKKVRQMLRAIDDLVPKSRDLVDIETGQCYSLCISECIDLLESLANNKMNIL